LHLGATPLPRTSKQQQETDRFRVHVANLLSEPGWHGYDYVHRWLEKLLKYDLRRPYTEAEREAVDRVVAARTMFEEWGGFSVPELIRAASQYMADYSYEDEIFLKELQNETQICLADMRQLVGLCRLAGLDLPRFKPAIEITYDDAA
jgi:hypothetical protein